MKVLVPGSYDPVTLGHLDVIRRLLERGDEVFAVIFINPEKSYLFSREDRIKMLSLATEGMERVHVDFSSGMVIDYMREKGLSKIVKGYRNECDLAYEKLQAEYNLKHGGYETEFLKSADALSSVSSTSARETFLSGGELSPLLPEKVIRFLSEKRLTNI